MFGDLSSFDTLEHAHLHHAKMIVSTIPDMLLKGTDNQTIVKTVRAIAPHATIVATADDNHHAEILREEGADVVVNPSQLSAETVVPEIVKVLKYPGAAVPIH
jgi:Trk K+ transport system NAD-binding subunit